MNKLYSKEKRDLTAFGYWVAVVLLCVVRLILATQGRVYLEPENSPIDDQMMYNAAVSITNGNWLGEYAYNTIGKQMFFSIWLAVVHWMGLPYLVANAALGVLAALLMASALSPVLKKKKWILAAFFSAAYCPVYFDAYNYRVYRDSITIQLLIIAIGGVAGFVLRWINPEWEKRNSTWFYAAAGGLGLGTSWLNREDGVWLLPFCSCMILIGLIVFFKALRKQDARKKSGRVLGNCVVYICATAVCLVSYAGMNYKTYGRFILSDLTSRDFTTAYGLLTGIEDDGVGRYRPITKETRQILYDNSAFFAQLEPYWESPNVLNGYGSKDDGEYGGSFYYGLRLANQFAGQYKDALETKAFYEQISQELLRLEQEGVIAIPHKRASTLAIWKNEYAVPILLEMVNGIKMAMWMPTFDPIPVYSIYSKDDLVADMLKYLKSDIVRGYAEDTDRAYCNILQRVVFAGETVLAWAWRILILPSVCIAWFVAISGCKKNLGYLFTVKGKVPKEVPDSFGIWVFIWGVLLSALLRIGIIAYVEVTTFGIGTFLMYLSTAVPLLGLAGFLGIYILFLRIQERDISK